MADPQTTGENAAMSKEQVPQSIREAAERAADEAESKVTEYYIDLSGVRKKLFFRHAFIGGFIRAYLRERAIIEAAFGTDPQTTVPVIAE